MVFERKTCKAAGCLLMGIPGYKNKHWISFQASFNRSEVGYSELPIFLSSTWSCYAKIIQLSWMPWLSIETYLNHFKPMVTWGSPSWSHLHFLGFSREPRPPLRSCPSWLFAAACAVSSGDFRGWELNPVLTGVFVNLSSLKESAQVGITGTSPRQILELRINEVSYWMTVRRAGYSQ